ncbi:MAG: proton-conducting transporter membrane subunit [Thermoleophilaceae bacterium]
MQTEWAPALAVLATVTIVIGNVGAIAQDSLKRMLAWSGVAQAGYLLAGRGGGHQARAAGDRRSTSPPTC